jgi:tetratricopeptide (TPR) repeat protein
VESSENTQTPEEQATVHVMLGDIYNAMGLLPQAQTQLNMAIAQLDGEQMVSSIQLARASVELARVKIATNQPSKTVEAGKLLDAVTPSLRRSSVPDIKGLLPKALIARAVVTMRMSKGADAVEGLREAISLIGAPDKSETGQLLCEARTILAQALCDIPERREQAVRVGEQAVSDGEQWAKENPAMRVTALTTLGVARRARGDAEGAIAAYGEALELAKPPTPVPGLTIAAIQVQLAQALRDVGRGDEAAKYAQKALKTRREQDPDSLRVADALDVTAGLAADKGDLASAEDQYREQLGIAERLGVRKMAAQSMTGLADVLVRQEKFEEALTHAKKALEIREELLKDGDWRLNSTRSVIGAALAGAGKCDEAEGMLTEAAEAMSKDKAAPQSVVKRVYERAIEMFERCRKPEGAKPWQERLKRLTNPEL